MPITAIRRSLSRASHARGDPTRPSVIVAGSGSDSAGTSTRKPFMCSGTGGSWFSARPVTARFSTPRRVSWGSSGCPGRVARPQLRHERIRYLESTMARRHPQHVHPPGRVRPASRRTCARCGRRRRDKGGLKGQPPQTSVRRVVFVRFNRDGSVDQSFGRDGVVEESEGPDYWWSWAVLPDGHVVALSSRNEIGGTAWWLHRFIADGAVDYGFGQAGSVRLGVSVLDAVSKCCLRATAACSCSAPWTPLTRPGRPRRSAEFCPGGGSIPASARPVVVQGRAPVRWEERLPQTAAYSRPPGGLSDTRASIASSSATARTAVFQVGRCA